MDPSETDGAPLNKGRSFGIDNSNPLLSCIRSVDLPSILSDLLGASFMLRAAVSLSSHAVMKIDKMQEQPFFSHREEFGLQRKLL